MVGKTSERYTDMPKGYITYPYNNDKNSSGLADALLTEISITRYFIKTGNSNIDKTPLSKSLWKELLKMGCSVYAEKQHHVVGRQYLTEMKIPVEIRKIEQKNKLKAIRIRITGKTEGVLLGNINHIKRYLDKWQIEPTSCVWSQGSWKEEVTENKKPIADPEDILKEQKRLNNIIADMQDKIRTLETPAIKKSIQNERKAKSDVLN